MSDFALIHRAVSKTSDSSEETTASLLFWKTCQRQIFFLDFENSKKFETQAGDTLYSGLEADVFLAEILCGLKSPLFGETEVYGQFKAWWKALPEDLFWKIQNRSRIESLFALVKNVREKVLCGSGSQSYGSLLRKHLKSESKVEVLGAGHLVQELLPWIESRNSYRIWCRAPEKIQFPHQADEICQIHKAEKLSPIVVIAAPMAHTQLNKWLQARDFTSEHQLFDFRADSEGFEPFVKPQVHLMLKDFASKSEEFQRDIEGLLQRSQRIIQDWKMAQEMKSQIRPYGWDDL
jgi:glutamyl-tRNA reductase